MIRGIVACLPFGLRRYTVDSILRGAPSGLPGAIAIARWDHIYDMVYEGQAMKFGLFYELSVPRPWTQESERTVYNNALEQVKLADELGLIRCGPWSIISSKSIHTARRQSCF
jgi:hypothetical protein